MATPVVLVPIRSFDGMTRLSGILDDGSRAALTEYLATTIIAACTAAGLPVVVITADDSVAAWAEERAVAVVHDPGDDLDDAASFAVGAMDDEPWIVVHADLPFASARALRGIAGHATRGTVLVPSLDGGTTVIGGTGAFPFSFGPGSFHRHLAADPHATVVVDPDLGIDIDTPAHLLAFTKWRRRSGAGS